MGERQLICDIAVIGGGMAGTLAAISAARSGAKVVLIEKQQCLGGIGTNGMVSELLGVGRNGVTFYGGITQKIFDTLVSQGDAAYNFKVPMSSNPNILVDRLRCNPESMKILLEKLVLKKLQNF